MSKSERQTIAHEQLLKIVDVLLKRKDINPIDMDRLRSAAAGSQQHLRKMA